MTSEFESFEPCPRCHVVGCKPVFARYTDGHGFCFYCAYTERASAIKRVVDFFSKPNPPLPVVPTRQDHPMMGGDGTQTNLGGMVKPLPYDSVKYQTLEMSQWLANYGITRDELMLNGVIHSPSHNWLIFPYYSDARMLLAWQARVFPRNRPEEDKDIRSKWLSFGPVHEIIHVIKPINDGLEEGQFPETVVLVEDIISAIKVGRVAHCMPVFGVGLTSKLATRLSKRYKRVVVWFDRDAMRKAHQVAAMASQFVDNTNTVISEKDPKSYSDEDIRGYLKEIK